MINNSKRYVTVYQNGELVTREIDDAYQNQIDKVREVMARADDAFDWVEVPSDIDVTYFRARLPVGKYQTYTNDVGKLYCRPRKMPKLADYIRQQVKGMEVGDTRVIDTLGKAPNKVLRDFIVKRLPGGKRRVTRVSTVGRAEYVDMVAVLFMTQYRFKVPAHRKAKDWCKDLFIPFTMDNDFNVFVLNSVERAHALPVGGVTHWHMMEMKDVRKLNVSDKRFKVCPKEMTIERLS